MRITTHFGPAPRLRFTLGWLAVVLLTAHPERVRADELDLSLFVPPVGRAATLWIDAPELAPHGTVYAGLALDYGHAWVDRSVVCGGPARSDDVAGSNAAARAACLSEADARPLVSDIVRAEALLAVSLFDAFELGVALPVVLTRAAPSVSHALATRIGAGDLRVSLGIPLALGSATRVAARIETSFPTAGARSWSGSPNWTLLPSLVVTQTFSQLTLAAKLGYQLRERVMVFGIEQDDEFVLHAGAAFAAFPALSVITDASARLGIGGLRLSKRELAIEVDLGVRLRGPYASSLELALGTNALPSDTGGFAPGLRGQLTVRGVFGPSGCAPGTCPASPTAVAADSDADGFADDIDVCPEDAEDRDGFADGDGCPDVDNDADGNLDAQDMCPDRSEDRDGFQDSDGCPDLDDDKDGVPDGADRCRRDPEDRDGFEDADGCPEPGPGRPIVTVSGSRILLSDNIYFDDEADTIRAPSTPLLDELARTLIQLPPHKRVRVEGYTDDAGNPQHNLDLSYRRAKAVVEYLKARGVPAERLEHAGYGGARPLASNQTPEGRALNRRVQFTVIDATP